MHATLERLQPWPLRVTAVSLLVAVSALAWVPHVAFGLHDHVHMTSLATSLVFGALAQLPW
jgi:hypothetical protein